MSKWKCKLSGTVIELPDYEDDNMVGHDGYDKVVEEASKEEPVKAAKKAPTKE